jgi:hypothetical protein
MEKHTVSALILAGAAVIGSVVQGLVLMAAKRKREAGKTEPGDSGDGSGTESDR